MADLADIDNVAPADSLKEGADKINLMRARLDGLYTILSDITAVEATQMGNLGTTTVSATQWAYLGALDQSLITTASPTFNGLTLTSLTLSGAFTLGGTLTLGGAVAGGDYAWTNVGDMTFAAGSIIASGSSNTNTLLFKANDTICITLTTSATDQMDLAAVKTLVAIGNLDIGAYTFTCAGLIDDTLTSGRVIFASAGGLLADDSDFLFTTDTLTVTKIGAFQATGAIDFNSQNMTSVDIDSGTIGGVTLDGAIAGGDQAFTGVGDLTFTNGSILAASATDTHTLLIKAGGLAGTTVITITSLDAGDRLALASVYSLTAINNLDIGAYTFRCNGLIDDSLTSGRVIFATTNGQLADAANMTFATDTLTVKKIVLNDATTATTCMLSLTPAGAVATTAEWDGICIDGDALDPSGVDAIVHGMHIDLSGVAVNNLPEIEGLHVEVPTGYTAIHANEQIHIDMDISALVAGTHRTGVDIVVDAVGSTGGYLHGYDIALVGAGLATVAGYSTHTGIDVIHQHIGTFEAADKCWEYDDSETSYADRTTAFGSAGTDVAIFDDDDDAIFIGHTSVFSEIEVILAIEASVDLKLTFWYSLAATWAQFYPSDDTDGFTQDGLIRFEADDLTGWVAQTVSASSQYYIKIVRTKNNVITSPTEDTILILDPTLYTWDKLGALTVLSIAVPTITTVTTFTAGADLDIGGYDLRALTLTADSLTSGRVPFASTNGLLIDDSDFTFDTATLSATNVTSSGTITTAALIATGNFDIGTYTFRCNGLIDDSLTSGRVIFATTNGQLADDSDFTFLTDTLSIANITSSGTITAAGFVATSNIDIGSYNFRAQNLTADNLPSGRVVLTSTNGLLVTDSDMTFVTDTLTVTKIGAFEATGAINFGSQAMTSVDINSGTVGGITFDGALTMSLGSDADGDIYYRASNVLTRLPKGTATHVLTMNVGATAPEWAAVSGRYVSLATVPIIWRMTTVSSGARTATVDNVSSTTITLTTAVSDEFFDNTYMSGNSYVSIYNTTRSQLAWVSAAPTATTLTVTVAGDISTWVNGDSVRTAFGTDFPNKPRIDVSPIVAAGATAIGLHIRALDSGTIANGKGEFVFESGGSTPAAAAQVQVSSINSYADAFIPLDANLRFDIQDFATDTDTLSVLISAVGYFK